MFVNRERELEALEARYRSSQAEFVIVTGRRRIGKTALLAAFAAGKRVLRFTAYLDSEESQLRRLSSLLRQLEQPELAPSTDFTYGTWEALFQTMGVMAAEERLLVILDEWPYLAGSGPRLASVLQHVWDEKLQHTHLMLVLSGSYLSIMERDILGQRAPLYGRRTGQLLLRPLGMRDATAFLPGYSAEAMVEAYAVVGGMPGYLLQFSDRHDLLDNLRWSVFNRDSFLFNEPDLLLREELREPRLYAALLRAIAAGHHRLGEITRAAGFADSSTTTRYLDTLRVMELVEHRRPIGPRRSGKTWGNWHLGDPYLRFWGRWILPYTTQIEFGETERLIQENLRPGWDRFVGFGWEELTRRHVHELAAEGTLPFWPEEVGSWWSNQAQIDVVAVNRGRRSAVLGEARWRRQKMGIGDLEQLQANGRIWLGEERGWELWYALFSRSGFRGDLRDRAGGDPHLLLVTPSHIVWNRR
ncbi:MAG: ATP-binding protein [bacterium]|nr:ATP-binding protein [bacterium]